MYSTSNPLFTEGQPDKGEGLENLAEDGDPSMLYANVMSKSGVSICNLLLDPSELLVLCEENVLKKES